MNYFDLVKQHKGYIKVQLMRVIDHRTMKYIYFIHTNLHCDYGITDEMLRSFHSTSKKAFNKKVNQYKKALNKKPRLVKTDNDQNYTRLIYELK